MTTAELGDIVCAMLRREGLSIRHEDFLPPTKSERVSVSMPQSSTFRALQKITPEVFMAPCCQHLAKAIISAGWNQARFAASNDGHKLTFSVEEFH